MAKIVKSDITSKMDSKRTDTINASVVWTNSAPPHSGIASWFENANNSTFSLSSDAKISASTMVSDIGRFVSTYSNIRKITYTQQYTKITLDSKGAQIGSSVVTESTTTNKGILSSTGASKGGVTYKPSIAANNAYIKKNDKITDDDVVNCLNDAITRWTNNYNATVKLTYNRGKVNWTNHSQRGRR